MEFGTWVIYLFACAALCFTPGPNSLLALSHGASYGFKRTIFTSAGGALGFAAVIAVCLAGLGALLAASATAFLVIKLVGAAYLIWLGIQSLRRPAFVLGADVAAKGLRRRSHFAQGFLAAATNPKGILFFVAFLPQFYDPARPAFLQFLILAATFASIEFFLELALAALAHRLRPWLAKASVGKWFKRVTGASFIGIGAGLATASGR
ncbi:LysE family translocator [Aestuariispira insulae]|uniref:Threonine/homoserine/homoserine lactone efflux protein n=1 Tax=Aestuariispira insulae TaxID=1461337 RepID=A0A3D9HK13_9PROT|nr:LysE family translocator [Aestuariispira insulae]RED49830.1 threonine/homoserine/homoserine lactone efflux protein [Aestuariispira insulae]